MDLMIHQQLVFDRGLSDVYPAASETILTHKIKNFWDSICSKASDPVAFMLYSLAGYGRDDPKGASS